MTQLTFKPRSTGELPLVQICQTMNDLHQKEEAPAVGLTFAEEAQAFCAKKKIAIQNQSEPRRLMPIYIRQATKTVPVVTGKISGARFIFDSPSLLNYCTKWCQSVYADTVIIRTIHHTGTVLLILPGKGTHYVQFVYHNNALSEAQRMFQQQIAPATVNVFHAFTPFADWIKKQVKREA